MERASTTGVRQVALTRDAASETARKSEGHDPSCPTYKAIHGAVGIECEHGFDYCPQCDRCTCGPFQPRVKPWMHACFGDVIPYDRTERGDRLLEEVFELLQSGGYDRARVAELADYTWSRPPGEPAQEVGGVMVTLAAYCLAHGLSMHEAGETELARIWTKVEAIRAKQAAKPRGIALPVDPATLQPDSAPADADAEGGVVSVETREEPLSPDPSADVEGG